MTTRIALSAAFALALSSGLALAQTAAPAPATMTSMGKKAEKPRTAQSLECSKKADAANVHGKPRSAFMRKCKSGKA